jgi:hypothetical protein
MKQDNNVSESAIAVNDMRPGNHYTEFRYLPLPAKCAIEYLDAQADRTLAKLDAYLEHYFRSSALECDEGTRRSARIIAVKRFRLDEKP